MEAFNEAYNNVHLDQQLELLEEPRDRELDADAAAQQAADAASAAVLTKYYPLTINEDEVTAVYGKLKRTFDALPLNALRIKVADHVFLNRVPAEHVNTLLASVTQRYQAVLRNDPGLKETEDVRTYEVLNNLLVCALQYAVMELSHAERSPDTLHMDQWDEWVEDKGSAFMRLMAQPWVETTLILIESCEKVEKIKEKLRKEDEANSRKLSPKSDDEDDERRDSRSSSERLPDLPADSEGGRTIMLMLRAMLDFGRKEKTANKLIKASATNPRLRQRILTLVSQAAHDDKYQRMKPHQQFDHLIHKLIKDVDKAKDKAEAERRLDSLTMKGFSGFNTFRVKYESYFESYMAACEAERKPMAARYAGRGKVESFIDRLHKDMKLDLMRNLKTKGETKDTVEFEEVCEECAEISEMHGVSRGGDDSDAGSDKGKRERRERPPRTNKHKRSNAVRTAQPVDDEAMKENLAKIKAIMHWNKDIWVPGDRMPEKGNNNCALTFNGHTCTNPKCTRPHAESRENVTVGKHIPKTVEKSAARSAAPDKGTADERIGAMEKLFAEMIKNKVDATQPDADKGKPVTVESALQGKSKRKQQEILMALCQQLEDSEESSDDDTASVARSLRKSLGVRMLSLDEDDDDKHADADGVGESKGDDESWVELCEPDQIEFDIEQAALQYEREMAEFVEADLAAMTNAISMTTQYCAEPQPAASSSDAEGDQSYWSAAANKMIKLPMDKEAMLEAMAQRESDDSEADEPTKPPAADASSGKDATEAAAEAAETVEKSETALVTSNTVPGAGWAMLQQHCSRDGCPCTSCWVEKSGRVHTHCCYTCAQGTACKQNYHPTPRNHPTSEEAALARTEQGLLRFGQSQLTTAQRTALALRYQRDLLLMVQQKDADTEPSCRMMTPDGGWGESKGESDDGDPPEMVELSESDSEDEDSASEREAKALHDKWMKMPMPKMPMPKDEMMVMTKSGVKLASEVTKSAAGEFDERESEELSKEEWRTASSKMHKRALEEHGKIFEKKGGESLGTNLSVLSGSLNPELIASREMIEKQEAAQMRKAQAEWRKREKQGAQWPGEKKSSYSVLLPDKLADKILGYVPRSAPNAAATIATRQSYWSAAANKQVKLPKNKEEMLADMGVSYSVYLADHDVKDSMSKSKKAERQPYVQVKVAGKQQWFSLDSCCGARAVICEEHLERAKSEGTYVLFVKSCKYYASPIRLKGVEGSGRVQLVAEAIIMYEFMGRKLEQSFEVLRFGSTGNAFAMLGHPAMNKMEGSIHFSKEPGRRTFRMGQPSDGGPPL
ncbi:MAG: hypothetical protein CMJ28_03665, partial [Phycisphaerae bacterium]|nr:hypothetical protein [Phycisphaerae bacterium]